MLLMMISVPIACGVRVRARGELSLARAGGGAESGYAAVPGQVETSLWREDKARHLDKICSWRITHLIIWYNPSDLKKIWTQHRIDVFHCALGLRRRQSSL